MYRVSLPYIHSRYTTDVSNMSGSHMTRTFENSSVGLKTLRDRPNGTSPSQIRYQKHFQISRDHFAKLNFVLVLLPAVDFGPWVGLGWDDPKKVRY